MSARYVPDLYSMLVIIVKCSSVRMARLNKSKFTGGLSFHWHKSDGSKLIIFIVSDIDWWQQHQISPYVTVESWLENKGDKSWLENNWDNSWTENKRDKSW